MKLGELIAKVNELRPSEYDKDELVQWLNEVEFLAVEVFEKAIGDKIAYTPYNYDIDAERELLIPDQFINVYTSYILSKIDFNNSELNKYNLDELMFENEWNTFASYYRRNYRPKTSKVHRQRFWPLDL